MEKSWKFIEGDCLEVMRSMEDDSVDLVFGSPPYENRRRYGKIDFKLKGEDWVAWMLDVVKESCRISKGLVAFVCQGKTEDFEWSAVPMMLVTDAKRAGLHVRCPGIYNRVGIPGSGGPDYLRNDYEFTVCFQGSAGKLPWSDNTACGHVPKHHVGGELSYRNEHGVRKNARGDRRNREVGGRRRSQAYTQPDKSNPGNVFNQKVYTAEDVEKILQACGGVDNYSDVFKTKVGGHLMGNELAHLNEAPMSLDYAEFYALSFCPPGGIVLDPFLGSGTTPEAALTHGRNVIGIDVRADQIEIATTRLETFTPKALF